MTDDLTQLPAQSRMPQPRPGRPKGRVGQAPLDRPLGASNRKAASARAIPIAGGYAYQLVKPEVHHSTYPILKALSDDLFGEKWCETSKVLDCRWTPASMPYLAV